MEMVEIVEDLVKWRFGKTEMVEMVEDLVKWRLLRLLKMEI